MKFIFFEYSFEPYRLHIRIEINRELKYVANNCVIYKAGIQ